MFYLLQSDTSWIASPSTANIAQIASAVITLLALLYAIIQGIGSKKDIEKLASIAVKLEEANSVQRKQNDILSQQLKMDNRPV
jgi:hypothetical protein